MTVALLRYSDVTMTLLWRHFYVLAFILLQHRHLLVPNKSFLIHMNSLPNFLAVSWMYLMEILSYKLDCIYYLKIYFTANVMIIENWPWKATYLVQTVLVELVVFQLLLLFRMGNEFQLVPMLNELLMLGLDDFLVCEYMLLFEYLLWLSTICIQQQQKRSITAQ